MTVIGITGPTGAGKTTALNELENLGGAVIDCDAVYHRLLEESMPLRQELEARFGPLKDARGDFDRKKLGAVVFRDPKALVDLNDIAHRYVAAEVERLLESAQREGRPAAAIDAIGLFESGLDRRCQTTVAVTAPPQVRVARIMAREGISEQYARSRVDAQNPAEFYTSRCRFALVNDCPSAEEFALQARRLFQAILGEGAGRQGDRGG